ncbi:MAG: DUF2786 domain-containing protein [Methylovulum sp.]|nr:DUF2786 domain-containing protein [Methylovulum sp.]
MKIAQDKALDKIKKCLRLAASSNANEAATALRQAQALMAAHNLTLTDVQASEVKKVMQKATVTDRPTQWENGLVQTVSKAFGCKAIFRVGRLSRQRGEWGFIGVDVSPELAAYAFVVLLKQLKRDRADYVKTKLNRCKPENRRARAVRFCEAWAWAVYEKVEAMAPNAIADQAITAYMEKNYSNSGYTKNRPNPKSTAHGKDNDLAAGFEAGKKAQLHHGVDAKSNNAKQLEVC